MNSRPLRLFATFALTGLLVFLFLRGMDIRETVEAIRSANPLALLIGFALGFAALWIRVWRWKRLLAETGNVPLRSAYHATAIGFGASVILPFKAGEVIRPILLARERKLPISRLLASVLIERLFDLVAILSLFLFSVFSPVGLKADPAYQRTISNGALVGLGALLALVSGLVFLAIFRERFLAQTLGRLRFLPENLRHRLEEFAGHCLEGLAALRRPVNLIVILAQSFFLWVVIDFQVWANLQAFRFSVPFRSTYLIVAFGAAGLAVPTPGGVGGFHKTTQEAVKLYGVSPANATAFAIVHHAACFIPVVLLGAISILMTGMSLRSVRTLAKETSDAPAGPSNPEDS